jgi:drug/metabolite transporter (DMT)-like permease
MSNRLLAWYFVIIWGSGFLATKAGLQYAAPFTFLALRFLIGLLLLLPIVWWLKPRWPTTRVEWFHVIVAGLLMHAIHLSGSHYAQYLGMSAGVVAILLAAQPLLTAAIAAGWLDERPTPRQWSGVVIGLAGVAMIVWHKLDIAAVSAGSLIAVAVALLALTLGTLYQRRFCATADLRASTVIQFAGSLLLLTPLAFFVEQANITRSWTLIASILFLVVFASIFAVSALHTLMRRGEATRVSSMLYWPPVVAVALELLLFGVQPTPITIAGVIVTSLGVALAARGVHEGAREPASTNRP